MPQVQTFVSSCTKESHIILIRFVLEVELRIPLLVTEYGADADLREGDLSMNAYRSLLFQNKMIRFVHICDQLSPIQHYGQQISMEPI